jgi:hypothetical protein
MTEPGTIDAGPGSFVERVFRAVDGLDPVEFGVLLAEDARMVFGNGEPLLGRAAILAGCAAFGETIAGLSHRTLRSWTVGPDTIVESAVTYRRLDGTEVTMPAVSIWTAGDDGLIDDYRVFYDLAPLYASG